MNRLSLLVRVAPPSCARLPLRSNVLALACAMLALTCGALTAAEAPPPADSLSDDASPAAQKQNVVPADQALKANPDDPANWQKYLSERLTQVFSKMEEHPNEALAILQETRAFVDSLTPEGNIGKQQKKSFAGLADRYEEMIEAMRVSLDELITQLQQTPIEPRTVRIFGTKLAREVGALTHKEPERAEKIFLQGKAAFDAAAQSVKDNDELRKLFDQQTRNLGLLERRIADGKKLLALIGQDAVPLNVEAWVNGEPLTHDDLKGKVVLLDFWAIWCGPCIATFPHLRDWQEKYADKGLVIIGLTRYYNYEWKEGADRPTRSMTEVSHEDEQAMLRKFAEHHELKHRFAIQKDASAAEFYAVTGIPHVVVIDQAGKVRLMRVGSGSANARDIDKLLAELLTKESATGEQ